MWFKICSILAFLLIGKVTSTITEKSVSTRNAVKNDSKETVEAKHAAKSSSKIAYVERPLGRFGFGTIPMPSIPGISIVDPVTENDTKIWATPGSTTTTMGSSAVLIKGGILGGLAALKAAILPPVFLGALIIFLAAGAVYFVCNIVDCSNVWRKTTSGFGSNPGTYIDPYYAGSFNRNSYDFYDQQVRPVYQALDSGVNKYETYKTQYSPRDFTMYKKKQPSEIIN